MIPSKLPSQWILELKVSNDLRNATALRDIQLRLHKIQSLSKHVADRVEDLHVKVDDFRTLLNNLCNTAAHTRANFLPRQQMPEKPSVFHGRDDLVQEIVQLLCEGKTSRVCILGPGGMGKTSLAVAVVESPTIQIRYDSHCFWVPCVEATSPSLLLQLLYSHLRISRATDDTLEDILSELNRSQEPRLILLDNFETPWNVVDGTRKEVGIILRRLAKLSHVAILVTMRGSEPPSDGIAWQLEILRPVDKEASLRIFHEIYPKSRDDPDVDHLLALLGYLPFAVTLMAKLGKKSRSSAKNLSQEWSHVGTGMISPSNSPEDNLNRIISLSVDSGFVQQDPGALALLATLSLLPAGTCRKNLRWWAPNHRSSSIATLSDAALLLTNNDGDSIEHETLFILPVVQSFMATTNQLPDSVRKQVQEACCQYVFDHACRYFEPLFKQHSKALAAEDTNIQSILLVLASSESSISPERVVQALLRFTWYRYDTRPSIEIAESTLNRARLLGEDRYIAEALSVLGGTYLRTRTGVGLQVLTEAFQLFDKLSGDRDTAWLAAQCGCFLARSKLSTHPAQHVISSVQNLQTKFGPYLDDFGRALILKEIGYCCYYFGRYSEALDSLRQATDTFMHMERLIDAAESMLDMAGCYHQSSELSKALESIEGASNIIKHIPHQRFQALIDKGQGVILTSLGRYTEALSKFEKSLILFEDLGALYQAASTVENFGYVYQCMDDSLNATVAYEAAIEKYAKIGQRSAKVERSIQRCGTNLAEIKKRIETPQVAISLLRPVI